MRILSQALLAALVSISLFFGVTSAGAQTKSASPGISKVVEAGKLRVGMTGNQPPLNFLGKSGQMMGFEVDLSTGLAKLMQAELEIVRMPFGDLLGALEKGDVDLVISGMTITPERNMHVAFVGPYYLSGKSILTKSSTLAGAESGESLNQQDITLVALAGSTSQTFVEVVAPSAKLVTAEDYDTAIQMLLDDEVQALVADQEIVALTQLKHPEAGLAALKEPFTIEPIGIAVGPGDPLFVNFLTNTLGGLESSGLLEALGLRWFGQGDWIAEVP